MGTHRRRICLTGPDGYQCAGLVAGAPMRPGLLAGDLQPPAEIAGLGAGRPIPGHSSACLQEPEPAKKIHPIRADRGLRPACRQKIPEIGRGRSHGHTVSVDQPVGLVTITRSYQPAGMRYYQRRQIPGRLIVSDHGARPCQDKSRRMR